MPEDHQTDTGERVTGRIALAVLVGGAGAIASLAGNIAGAPSTAVGVWVAIWITVAVVAAAVLVELTPIGARTRLSMIRWVGVGWLVLAAGAGSFIHLRETAELAGYDGWVGVLVALTPDSLILVSALTIRHLRDIALSADSASGTPLAGTPAHDAPLGPQALPVPTPTQPPARPALTVTGGGRTAAKQSVEADVVAALHDRPDATDGQIAAVVGCSDRTVRRHRAKAAAA